MAAKTMWIAGGTLAAVLAGGIGACNYFGWGQKKPEAKPVEVVKQGTYVVQRNDTAWDLAKLFYPKELNRENFKNDAEYRSAVARKTNELMEAAAKKYPNQKHLLKDVVAVQSCGNGKYGVLFKSDGIKGDGLRVGDKISYTFVVMEVPGQSQQQQAAVPDYVAKHKPVPKRNLVIGGCEDSTNSSSDSSGSPVPAAPSSAPKTPKLHAVPVPISTYAPSCAAPAVVSGAANPPAPASSGYSSNLRVAETKAAAEPVKFVLDNATIMEKYNELNSRSEYAKLSANDLFMEARSQLEKSMNLSYLQAA